MTITINWDAIFEAVAGAAEGAVNATADRVVTKAQRYVPVRQVFYGGHNIRRFKTEGEVKLDNARRQLTAHVGLKPADMMAAPPGVTYSRGLARSTGWATTTVKRSRVHDFQPRLPGLGKGDWRRVEKVNGQWQMADPRAQAMLTGRGLSYLRNGEAISTQAGEAEGSVEEARKNDLGPERSSFARGRQGELEYLAAVKAHVEKLKANGDINRLGGTLRGTIHAVPAVRKNKRFIEAYVEAGGPEAPYGPYQEFGTRHNAANPFLRPALKDGEAVLSSETRKATGAR